jgi:hypothetical protein
VGSNPHAEHSDGDDLGDGSECESSRLGENLWETECQSDPTLTDTDGGGTHDGIEYSYSFHMDRRDPSDDFGDMDGDGVGILEELAQGTDPRTFDGPGAVNGLPDAAQIGDDITVTGDDFGPGEDVTITMFSTPILLGTATADAQGRVTFTFTVPDGVGAGTHHLELRGTESGIVKREAFEVEATPPSLRVDVAELRFSKKWPGAVVVTGGVDDALTRCPRVIIAVDGRSVVSTRTVRLLGVCVGLSSSGLVTFDLRSASFGFVGILPRGFTVDDPSVDIELTLDGEPYATTVTGELRRDRWTYRNEP